MKRIALLLAVLALSSMPAVAFAQQHDVLTPKQIALSLRDQELWNAWLQAMDCKASNPAVDQVYLDKIKGTIQTVERQLPADTSEKIYEGQAGVHIVLGPYSGNMCKAIVEGGLAAISAANTTLAKTNRTDPAQTILTLRDSRSPQRLVSDSW